MLCRGKGILTPVWLIIFWDSITWMFVPNKVFVNNFFYFYFFYGDFTIFNLSQLFYFDFFLASWDLVSVRFVLVIFVLVYGLPVIVLKELF
jgi:hypothetical protein